MKQYLDLVRTVIEHGEQRPDRTGTDTLSVFGTQTKYQNHVEGLRQQRARAPFELPRARVADQPIDEIAFADIELVGHRHHPFIRLPIAV